MVEHPHNPSIWEVKGESSRLAWAMQDPVSKTKINLVKTKINLVKTHPLPRIKEDQEEEAVFRDVVSFTPDPLPGEVTEAPTNMPSWPLQPYSSLCRVRASA